MSGGSLFSGTALIAGLGILGALAACPRGTTAASSLPPAATVTVQPRRRKEAAYQIAYTWRDPNHLEKPQGRGRPQKLECILEIPKSRLLEAMNTFGATEAYSKITYGSEEERRRKEARWKEDLRAHGFRVSPDNENACELDFPWILEHSREDLARFNRDLLQLAQDHHYSTVRDYAGLVASLVQSLEYRVPPTRRTNPDGRKVIIGGLTIPLETMYKGQGDCDTKCMAFAAIVGNLKDSRFALMLGDNHAFLGFQTSPLIGDHYVVIGGAPYILMELTDTWPLGTLAPEAWEKVQGNVYKAEVLE